MKDFLASILIVLVMIASSCNSDDLPGEDEDPSIQAGEDSVTIVNYFDDLGFEPDSILESGVYIKILDEGDGSDTTILESDVVTYNFIGKMLNDTIFETTIEEVGDSIRLAVEANITEGDTLAMEYAYLAKFSEETEYRPNVDVYTANGWTLSGFINGFADGIIASFPELKVGGSVLIVIPSGEAYGTFGSGTPYLVDGESTPRVYAIVPPNSILTFEFFIIDIQSQTGN